MTPRTVLIFLALFAAVLFGEWYQFLRGFDMNQWPASNWLLFAFILLAEAGALLVIAATIERALPTGARPPQDAAKVRRGSGKSRAR